MPSLALCFLKTDQVMDRIINSVGEIAIQPHGISMFEALVYSIISQQISTNAAKTIRCRFIGLYSPIRFPSPLDVINTPSEELRKVGLSNAKVNYIHGLAQSDISGTVPTLDECVSLEDCQIIEALTNLKGIGLWSAQMILIFNLNRSDVFPATDGGILRALALMYFDGAVPTPREALDSVSYTHLKLPTILLV